MKKKTILWCITLVCGLAGVFWLRTRLLVQVDQVTITEKVVRGDPDLAEGISLRVRSQYYDTVSWDTQFVVGKEEEAKTVFDSTYDYPTGTPASLLAGIPFFMELLPGNVTVHGNFKDMSSCIEANSQLEPLREILVEMDEQCENGKSKVKTITLEDYFSYYPVYVRCQANHGKLGLMMDGTFHRIMDDLEWNRLLTQKMREYFHIPMKKGDRLTVGITKDAKGKITSVWTGAWAGDFGMNCFYTVTEAGLYFAWSMPPEEYDFSQVPGGYGLYFVPLKNVDGKACLVLDEMRMVMSLEEVSDLGIIYSNAKGDTLVIHNTTTENELPGIMIVDTAKGQIVQQLGYGISEEWEISEEGRVNRILQIVVKDDILLIDFVDWNFLLYEKNAEGTYDFCFGGRPFSPTEEEKEWLGTELPISMLTHEMKYNGQYLAVAAFVPVGGGSALDSCDVSLALYGEDGLAYYGVYESSLTSGQYGDNYKYLLIPDMVDPLTMNWE